MQPPGHAGTVNRRLVDKAFCGAFEMVHGTIDPGPGAVVEIPPRVDHLIVNCRDTPLKLLVLYKPAPAGARRHAGRRLRTARPGEPISSA